MQGVLPELEPYLGGRGVFRHGQEIRVQRVHRDQVQVPSVARGREAAAVPCKTRVVAYLDGLFRHQAQGGITRAGGQFPDGGRQVDGQPVPEAAARGRVRVMNGDGEAFCPFRRIGPGKLRGPVAAAHAEMPLGLPDYAAEVVAVKSEC